MTRPRAFVIKNDKYDSVTDADCDAFLHRGRGEVLLKRHPVNTAPAEGCIAHCHRHRARGRAVLSCGPLSIATPISTMRWPSNGLRPVVSISMTISRMLYAASILDIVMITPFSSPNGSSPDTSLQVCPTSPQAGRAGVAPAISAGPPMTISRTLTPRQTAC